MITSGLKSKSLGEDNKEDKNKDSPFSSIKVPNRETIETILLKINKRSTIDWVKGKYGYKCSVMNHELGKFSVSYWSKKSTVTKERMRD